MSSEESSTVDESDSSAESTVMADIKKGSCIPLLAGKPPHLVPLLLLELKGSGRAAIFEKLITWGDSLFVIEIILKGLADHMDNLSSLITSGQLDHSIDPEILGGWHNRTTEYIDRIKKSLSEGHGEESPM